MLNKIKNLFVVQPNIGFVSAQDSRLSELLDLPAATRVTDSIGALHSGQTAVWAPASARRLRIVEGAMAVGVMAYFASGLAGTLGLF